MKQEEDIFFSDGISIKDEKIFKIFFETFYEELCHFALKFVDSPEAAEEIVQALFIHIWEKRDELDIRTSWKPYLYTSVRNRSLNYLKSKYVKTVVNTDVPEDLHPSENSTEEGYDYREIAELVRAGIESLPERCRLIFTLSRNGGLSYREISEELGISQKTVEAQMGIALKKLHAFVDRRRHLAWLPAALGFFL